ncbi:hypothetical protein LSTR_LSTR008855 [Laodelphax striatellus]|uniref:Uncharacterized protein n=1 Tax=Laodelphax striatellus TaxID=195883 RepID=A0A482WU16_LAOST|nr:hypothetical protein LSTR_LSTR008855 [Laodelphax striatellus]
MKHELLIFISTLPCCLLFAGVGIQIKQEPYAPQPNASAESTTKESSSKPQERADDQHIFFGGVPIQISRQSETDRSVDQARNIRIHVTQNNSYHDIEVPYSSAVDEDSPAVRQSLHDLIFENSKQGAHSRPKCEYTDGKKCDDKKKVNDVDLSEEHGSKNKVIENFKRPDVITIPRGSEIFPHHHNTTPQTSTKIPLPEDEFPFDKSIPVNSPPTPSYAHFPTSAKNLPTTHFPYNESIAVHTAPTPTDDFVPAVIPDKNTTPKPSGIQTDMVDGHVALLVVIAIMFFGVFCSILYYFYAGNIRSCGRRQRQILIEEFDEEDGTRMEMNPRNPENQGEVENNGENEENAPL